MKEFKMHPYYQLEAQVVYLDLYYQILTFARQCGDLNDEETLNFILDFTCRAAHLETRLNVTRLDLTLEDGSTVSFYES